MQAVYTITSNHWAINKLETTQFVFGKYIYIVINKNSPLLMVNCLDHRMWSEGFDFGDILFCPPKGKKLWSERVIIICNLKSNLAEFSILQWFYDNQTNSKTIKIVQRSESTNLGDRNDQTLHFICFDYYDSNFGMSENRFFSIGMYSQRKNYDKLLLFPFGSTVFQNIFIFLQFIKNPPSSLELYSDRYFQDRLIPQPRSHSEKANF